MDKKKIVLMGPMLPYRSGIAQHTTMLHRALTQKSNLLSISFKRQYPSFLFPGKSDLSSEYNSYKEPDVRYIIDSLNPMTWIETCNLISKYKPHLVIIPWWTFFWFFCFSFIVKTLKRKGLKVFFLCHNACDHEYSRWKDFLTRSVLSGGDYFLSHSKKDAEHLKTFLPGSNVFFYPHPLYNQFPPAKGLLKRRASLELLFYGLVRHYKGLDILLKAMALLKDKDIFLTIAGEWWMDDKKLLEFIRINELNDKIEIINRYLSEEESAEYFARSDAVVLPYRSASGSGVISLAYHYGRPVIVTKVGGLQDVVEDGLSGVIVTPEDPAGLAEAIKNFKNSPVRPEGVAEISGSMTWEKLAETILDIDVRCEAGSVKCKA